MVIRSRTYLIINFASEKMRFVSVQDNTKDDEGVVALRRGGFEPVNATNGAKIVFVQPKVI